MRVLIVEIKPPAERGVDLAFGLLADPSEADCRPLAIGLVDVGDEATVFFAKLRRFRLPAMMGLPIVFGP